MSRATLGAAGPARVGPAMAIGLPPAGDPAGTRYTRGSRRRVSAGRRHSCRCAALPCRGARRDPSELVGRRPADARPAGDRRVPDVREHGVRGACASRTRGRWTCWPWCCWRSDPLALVVAPRVPARGAVLAAAAVVVYFGLGYPGSPMPAAAVIALFSATVAGHHHVAAAVAATSIVVLTGWTSAERRDDLVARRPDRARLADGRHRGGRALALPPRAPGAGARGAGRGAAPPGGRGAAADRAGAARRARPPRLADQRAGRRRAVPARRRPGAGPQRARRDQAIQPRAAAGDALDARRAARRRRTRPRTSRPPAWTGWTRCSTTSAPPASP